MAKNIVETLKLEMDKLLQDHKECGKRYDEDSQIFIRGKLYGVNRSAILMLTSELITVREHKEIESYFDKILKELDKFKV